MVRAIVDLLRIRHVLASGMSRLVQSTVQHTDKNDQPIRNTRATYRLIRHKFLFGCNIFRLEPANADSWQSEYQRQFKAIFNFATLPFYWGLFEPEQGQEPAHRMALILVRLPEPEPVRMSPGPVQKLAQLLAPEQGPVQIQERERQSAPQQLRLPVLEPAQESELDW